MKCGTDSVCLPLTSTFSLLPSVHCPGRQLSRQQQVLLPLGFQWVLSWGEQRESGREERSGHMFFWSLSEGFPGAGSVPTGWSLLLSRWLLFMTPPPMSCASLWLLLDCGFLWPFPIYCPWLESSPFTNPPWVILIWMYHFSDSTHPVPLKKWWELYPFTIQ